MFAYIRVAGELSNRTPRELALGVLEYTTLTDKYKILKLHLGTLDRPKANVIGNI